MNRKTFYYHFEDIYDLLKWTFEQAEKLAGKKLEPGYKMFLSNFYVEAMAGILIDWIKNREI